MEEIAGYKKCIITHPTSRLVLIGRCERGDLFLRNEKERIKIN